MIALNIISRLMLHFINILNYSSALFVTAAPACGVRCLGSRCAKKKEYRASNNHNTTLIEELVSANIADTDRQT